MRPETRELIEDLWDDIKFEVKFQTWWYWREFVYWWKYGQRESADDTWVTFKIRAEAEGDKSEDEYAFVDYVVDELDLSFGGAFGSYGEGCNGWVEGPPDRMQDARKKLVAWFARRGLKSIYVSGLRNYHKPYPHPEFGV